MSGQFPCHKHGRSHLEYQYWRWQPHDCSFKRFEVALRAAVVVIQSSKAPKDKPHPYGHKKKPHPYGQSSKGSSNTVLRCLGIYICDVWRKTCLCLCLLI